MVRDGSPPAEAAPAPCYDRRMALPAPGFGLEGAVVAITGGGAGLGRACAEVLSRCGAAVALIERDRERAESAAAALVDAGADAMALTCDVREADQVEAAVDAVRR